MSEATLQQFLERLNGDASFRESVEANPEGALAAFGLSPAEQAVLSSGDEDALRRLTGADASGYALFNTWGTYCMRCSNTPGSGKHCGTGGGTHDGTVPECR